MLGIKIKCMVVLLNLVCKHSLKSTNFVVYVVVNFLFQLNFVFPLF